MEDKNQDSLSPDCKSSISPEKDTPLSCCGRSSSVENKQLSIYKNIPWITGIINTPAGDIPKVNTKLSSADKIGAWKVRLGAGRMKYSVEPGLYAIGNPAADSPVLVTANYKLSFDYLRSKLDDYNAWIIVLDTRGINVWCAAGKGTFGTYEIVNRIKAVRLSEIVSHKNLVLPQLGAPGVRAHEVKRLSGFRVVYGPVRADDLPLFFDAGMEATPEMRRVRFNLLDRAVLIPLELVLSLKYVLGIVLFLMILSGLGEGGYSIERVIKYGYVNGILFLGGCMAGVIFTPLLLPWLPGKAFSVKGVWIGIVYVLCAVIYTLVFPGVFGNRISIMAWIFIIPAITSFAGMNFTGATPFTSLSGVKKEMRYALPIQVIFAITGAAFWLIGRFV